MIADNRLSALPVGVKKKNYELKILLLNKQSYASMTVEDVLLRVGVTDKCIYAVAVAYEPPKVNIFNFSILNPQPPTTGSEVQINT